MAFRYSPVRISSDRFLGGVYFYSHWGDRLYPPGTRENAVKQVLAHEHAYARTNVGEFCVFDLDNQPDDEVAALVATAITEAQVREIVAGELRLYAEGLIGMEHELGDGLLALESVHAGMVEIIDHLSAGRRERALRTLPALERHTRETSEKNKRLLAKSAIVDALVVHVAASVNLKLDYKYPRRNEIRRASAHWFAGPEFTHLRNAEDMNAAFAQSERMIHDRADELHRWMISSTLKQATKILEARYPEKSSEEIEAEYPGLIARTHHQLFEAHLELWLNVYISRSDFDDVTKIHSNGHHWTDTALAAHEKVLATRSGRTVDVDAIEINPVEAISTDTTVKDVADAALNELESSIGGRVFLHLYDQWPENHDIRTAVMAVRARVHRYLNYYLALGKNWPDLDDPNTWGHDVRMKTLELAELRDDGTPIRLQPEFDPDVLEYRASQPLVGFAFRDGDDPTFFDPLMSYGSNVQQTFDRTHQDNDTLVFTVTANDGISKRVYKIVTR